MRSALRSMGLAAIALIVSTNAACGENSGAAEEEAVHEELIEMMRAQGATEEEIAAFRRMQADSAAAREKTRDETTAERSEKEAGDIENPAAKAAAAGAAVTFEGETYALKPYGVCSAGADGAYNIWFVTPDENEPDVAKEGAPRLHAFSNGEWSRLEFHVGGAKAADIYREGEERIAFPDGRLFYEGPIDGGARRSISVDAQC